MHERILAEAALPTQAVILGLRMQPYSLGHELWLIRENNPFAVGGEVTRDKLAEAALICSETWLGAQAMNHDWRLPAKLLLWRFRSRKEITGLAAEDFKDYRARGSLCVPIVPPRPGQIAQRRPGSPFLIRLQMFLMEHLGLSEAAAWDYPLGLAMIKRAAYFEEREGLEVENELDVETRKFQESNDARLKVFIDSGMTDSEAWEQLFKEGLSCPA